MSSNISITRICKRCGTEFIARTTVTQYCSHSCSQKAYKAKRRAGKIETSNRETKQILQKPIEEIKAKEFLTVPDLAKLLNSSKRTIYYLIQRGIIKAVNLSERKTLIRRAEIDKLFDLPQQVIEEKKQPTEFVESECYNVADLRKKYSISQAALRNLILKHNIPTFYKGWFAYVP
ncbi:MAG: helix-turn-helix domain-containing protein, partial [Flavisolibacter sp.]|nr:helix-turn-helix domain-containing protein [Flavisolibacter sp.]